MCVTDQLGRMMLLLVVVVVVLLVVLLVTGCPSGQADQELLFLSLPWYCSDGDGHSAPPSGVPQNPQRGDPTVNMYIPMQPSSLELSCVWWSPEEKIS